MRANRDSHPVENGRGLAGSPISRMDRVEVIPDHEITHAPAVSISEFFHRHMLYQIRNKSFAIFIIKSKNSYSETFIYIEGRAIGIRIPNYDWMNHVRQRSYHVGGLFKATELPSSISGLEITYSMEGFHCCQPST